MNNQNVYYHIFMITIQRITCMIMFQASEGIHIDEKQQIDKQQIDSLKKQTLLIDSLRKQCIGVLIISTFTLLLTLFSLFQKNK